MQIPLHVVAGVVTGLVSDWVGVVMTPLIWGVAWCVYCVFGGDYARFRAAWVASLGDRRVSEAVVVYFLREFIVSAGISMTVAAGCRALIVWL